MKERFQNQYIMKDRTLGLSLISSARLFSIQKSHDSQSGPIFYCHHRRMTHDEYLKAWKCPKLPGSSDYHVSGTLQCDHRITDMKYVSQAYSTSTAFETIIGRNITYIGQVNMVIVSHMIIGVVYYIGDFSIFIKFWRFTSLLALVVSSGTIILLRQVSLSSPIVGSVMQDKELF